MSTASAPELVFRQVHPHHWDGTNPHSVAFSPTPKDKDLLSVDDTSMVSAEGSWTRFTKILGFQSVGTWAVTSSEVAASGELTLRSDPITGQADAAKNNPAHCLIDFSKLTTKGQRKRCAQQLALHASARGSLFKPAA